MSDDKQQLYTQGTGSPIIVFPGARWQTGMMVLALALSMVSLYVVATRTDDYTSHITRDLTRHMDDVKRDMSARIDTLERHDHDYHNDISMWETDVYTHTSQVEAKLNAMGVDTSKFRKIKPPPE